MAGDYSSVLENVQLVKLLSGGIIHFLQTPQEKLCEKRFVTPNVFTPLYALSVVEVGLPVWAQERADTNVQTVLSAFE